MKKITYCPRCGQETATGARFCQNCGSPIGGGQVYDHQDSSQAPGDGDKNNRLMITLCIVLAVTVVIAAALCIILIGRRNGDKSRSVATTAEVQATDFATTAGSTETADPVTTTAAADRTAKSTDGALESGGDNSMYTDAQLSEAAVNYCKLVYCYANPSVKVEKKKDGKARIVVSVTIDGHTGECGAMLIDRVTGQGTGCKGESADLFSVDMSYVEIYYIIPYSDSRILTDSDLEKLSLTDLTLARNEIYARHGRMFKDDDIRQYFENQAWYAGIIPADQFDDSVLSRIEKANISTIKEYEDWLKGDATTQTDRAVGDDEYIIPYSSELYLTEDDLAGMDDRTLMLARNEIYARHGRIFNDAEIRAFFENKTWYDPAIAPADFSEDMLSEVEKANISFIKSHEE